MDFLVFRSSKSGNRVILPADHSMIIDRANGSAVVYAIGGNGPDRMVWELPDVHDIKVVPTMREALSLHLPGSDASSAAKAAVSETASSDDAS